MGVCAVCAQVGRWLGELGADTNPHPTHAHMHEQMQRNPSQCMSQIQKAMDPRMLQQMGGSANIMNMMKEMSKMEGEGGGGGLAGLMGGM